MTMRLCSWKSRRAEVPENTRQGGETTPGWCERTQQPPATESTAEASGGGEGPPPPAFSSWTRDVHFQTHTSDHTLLPQGFSLFTFLTRASRRDSVISRNPEAVSGRRTPWVPHVPTETDARRSTGLFYSLEA